MKICVSLNSHKQRAIECAVEIVKFLSENNVDILAIGYEADCLKEASIFVKKYESFDKIFKICDLAIAIGGDGKMIHVAWYAAVYDVPLIGVNVGRVGFATELEPFEYTELKRLISGDFSISPRMLIKVETVKNGVSDISYAVNEVVISRGSLSKIIDLSVSLNGEKVTNYRADGLLFATPTGSTAYSLSAGGPVVDPDMEAIILTPICPYSLSARCVLFNADSILSVEAETAHDGECFVTIDGRKSFEVTQGDNIIISKAQCRLKLIKLKNKNFFNILNEKFGMGD